VGVGDRREVDNGVLTRRGHTKAALAGGGRGERRGRDAPLGFDHAQAPVLARRNVGPAEPGKGTVGRRRW